MLVGTNREQGERDRERDRQREAERKCGEGREIMRERRD